MKYILTLILIITMNWVSAQQYFCNCDPESLDQTGIITQDNLLGTHFINRYISNPLQFYGEWADGNVLLENGRVVKNQTLQYNGLYDEILWKRKSNNQVASLEKSTIRGVEVFDEDGRPYLTFEKVNLKTLAKFDSSEVFLQVLANGKITLYASRKVAVVASNNELYLKYKYYMLKDGKMSQVFPKRFSLLLAMNNEKGKMKEVIRKNNLKIRNEQGLTEAILLYNKQFTE